MPRRLLQSQPEHVASTFRVEEKAKQETSMKQVASRATPLPKAQVYIEKQEATARQLSGFHWLSHKTE
jgi:hypothetical protein